MKTNTTTANTDEITLTDKDYLKTMLFSNCMLILIVVFFVGMFVYIEKESEPYEAYKKEFNTFIAELTDKEIIAVDYDENTYNLTVTYTEDNCKVLTTGLTNEFLKVSTLESPDTNYHIDRNFYTVYVYDPNYIEPHSFVSK